MHVGLGYSRSPVLRCSYLLLSFIRYPRLSYACSHPINTQMAKAYNTYCASGTGTNLTVGEDTGPARKCENGRGGRSGVVPLSFFGSEILYN